MPSELRSTDWCFDWLATTGIAMCDAADARHATTPPRAVVSKSISRAMKREQDAASCVAQTR
jgi:hypothetical protein